MNDKPPTLLTNQESIAPLTLWGVRHRANCWCLNTPAGEAARRPCNCGALLQEIERLRAALGRIEDASNLVKWEGLRAQPGLALKAIHDEASAALSGEPRLAHEPSGWRHIETAPRRQKCLFWVVPKTADETYVDSSGKPIVGAFEPYLLLEEYGAWSGLAKATHWMPAPSPPLRTE